MFSKKSSASSTIIIFFIVISSQTFANGFAIDIVYKANADITCLENDLYVENSWVVCYGKSIAVLKSGDTEIDIIAGDPITSDYREGVRLNAHFKVVQDIIWLNQTHIIALDEGSDCLRLLDRTTNRTSRFIGSCTSPGKLDGKFESAQFDTPVSMLMIDKSIYILDFTHHQIRIANLLTETVTSVKLAAFIHSPEHIRLDPSHKFAYIAFSAGIAGYYFENGVAVFLGGSTTYGDEVGFAHRNAFTNINWIQVIGEGYILISDSHNRQIKLLDVNNSWISTVTHLSQYDFNVYSQIRDKFYMVGTTRESTYGQQRHVFEWVDFNLRDYVPGTSTTPTTRPTGDSICTTCSC